MWLLGSVIRTIDYPNYRWSQLVRIIDVLLYISWFWLFLCVCLQSPLVFVVLLFILVLEGMFLCLCYSYTRACSCVYVILISGHVLVFILFFYQGTLLCLCYSYIWACSCVYVILISISVESVCSEDKKVPNIFLSFTIFHLQIYSRHHFVWSEGYWQISFCAGAVLTSDTHSAVRTKPKLFQRETWSIPHSLKPYHSNFAASIQLFIYIFPHFFSRLLQFRIKSHSASCSAHLKHKLFGLVSSLAPTICPVFNSRTEFFEMAVALYVNSLV